ncbi:MAG: methyltransferase domain-containing protein [Cyanobacteria bacterium]|nr:methyltransferase domain-containing protein [Cyanobacteriota bacterium]
MTGVVPVSRLNGQDPAKPDFWEYRYQKEYTPWDMGGVPRRLVNFVEGLSQPASILIPGCGSAHEARLFAQREMYVTAVDFSPSAVMRAKDTLGNLPGDVVLADFLSYDSNAVRFDYIYERAFLCSLPPILRSRYMQQCAKLLRPGGRLFGYFFISEGEGGPPFPISSKELALLLNAEFKLVADEAAGDESLAVFEGQERFQVWEKL